MKRLFVFALLLFSFSTIFAQSDWVDFKADEHFVVKFPTTPKDVEGAQNSVMSLDEKDSAVYILTVVDFNTVADLDSATLAQQDTTADFVSGLKTGMLNTMPGFSLDDFVIGKWKGLTSYTTQGFDTDNNFWTLCIIKNTKLYALSVLIPKTKTPMNKDYYFSSPQVVP